MFGASRRCSMVCVAMKTIAIAIIGTLLAFGPANTAMLAPTDSGLPETASPNELKPDGQGAGSPDKRFWINPEDERRKAEGKPVPTPTPVTPEEMQRMSRRLDVLEQRLEALEAAPKPAAAAPPEPQRRQKAQ